MGTSGSSRSFWTPVKATWVISGINGKIVEKTEQHSSGKIIPELHIKSITEKTAQGLAVRSVKWQKPHLEFVKGNLHSKNF